MCHCYPPERRGPTRTPVQLNTEIHRSYNLFGHCGFISVICFEALTESYHLTVHSIERTSVCYTVITLCRHKVLKAWHACEKHMQELSRGGKKERKQSEKEAVFKSYLSQGSVFWSSLPVGECTLWAPSPLFQTSWLPDAVSSLSKGNHSHTYWEKNDCIESIELGVTMNRY